MSRFRRLNSSRFLHQPTKRRIRYSPARTARYSRKLNTPPLIRKMATSSPTPTNAVQTASSQDRRLQISFKIVRKGFMGPESEEILYLKMPPYVRRTTVLERSARNNVWQASAPRQQRITPCCCGLCCASRYK